MSIKMKNIITFLILAVLNTGCTSQISKPLSPDSFLKESYDTRDFLKRSLSSAPKEAYFKTDAGGVKALDVNWPGDAIIKSVEENQPWKNHSHYNFTLDISDTDLFSYNQTNSYSMTAVILLDYYFSGLADLGFINTGEPHTQLFYPIQFISNTWFKQNCNIIVVGSVYINIENKTALVAVDISEIY
jgi:hypothetical protein